MTCACGESFTPAPRHRGPKQQWCNRCRHSWSRKQRVRAGVAVPTGLAPRCACGRRMRLQRAGPHAGVYADRCGPCRRNDTRPRAKKLATPFVPLPPIDWSKVRRVVDARTSPPARQP